MAHVFRLGGSAVVSCIVVFSLMTGCERKCPPGTVVTTTNTCAKVETIASTETTTNSQLAQAGAVAAGSTENQPMSTVGQTAPAAATGGAGVAAMTMTVPASGAAGDSSMAASTNAAASAVAGTGAPAASAPAEMSVPACTSAGEIKCSDATAGARERCENGMWVPSTPCSAGEVCGGPDTTKPGECLMLAEVCQGKHSMKTCDGNGMLYECDENGEVQGSPQPCDSAELCNIGLAAGQCALCVPGATMCSGASLLKCTPDGSDFAPSDTCDSPELCNAQSGRCDAPACASGELRCMGSDLYRCNRSLTEFEREMSCTAGCNAQRKQCNECDPSSRPRCEGRTTVLSCRSDGSGEVRDTCPDVCNNGVCAECLSTDAPRACGNGVGQCAGGRQSCVAGRWGLCVEPPASKEICDNGKDNDCNGKPDDCGGTANPTWTCESKVGPLGCYPVGSYKDSCNNCKVSGGQLTCECCDGAGCSQKKRSSAPASCKGAIYQYGGCLVCPDDNRHKCEPGCAPDRPSPEDKCI